MALVATGCSSEQAAPASSTLPAVGPPNVVRVALADFHWPLDPALAAGRDELTLARALYSTPLRTDPSTGGVLPGLCTAWRASPDFRRWTFTCRSAAPIAAALRRVKRLEDAPARRLFADAVVAAPSATTLVVNLPYRWRRFPYALTVVGAAPRFVPGPFELLSGTPRLVVVKGQGTTVQFRRLAPLAAVREFRRGALDEAPVPLGDLVASKADPQLGPSVRARTLLGLDVVDITGYSERFRRVYWQTADRGDYEQLITELDGSSASGFLGGEKPDPAAFRRAVDAIPTLPRLSVPFAVPTDRTLRYGARLLYAQWRDVGLGPRLVSGPRARSAAGIRRALAAYPQQEALFAEIVPGDSRAAFLRALGAAEQRTDLESLDEELRARASLIPVVWVVDARLVSPRLEGWREDVLGNVDYSGVRSLASSRRP
ncbi:MAG: hypothetical protein H0W90_16530 [Actinobacteria bacterium]|nr:hypothetical protein [Actinomycetota bacterium]